MSIENEILSKIETKMIEKRINKSALANMVNRHKSTISKFFNRESYSRSPDLILEVLKVLNIPYSISNKHNEIIINEITENVEKSQYKKWLKCLGVDEFCSKKYNIVKRILNDL